MAIDKKVRTSAQGSPQWRASLPLTLVEPVAQLDSRATEVQRMDALRTLATSLRTLTGEVEAAIVSLEEFLRSSPSDEPRRSA